LVNIEKKVFFLQGEEEEETSDVDVVVVVAQSMGGFSKSMCALAKRNAREIKI
jgi:hypothetical protein